MAGYQRVLNEKRSVALTQYLNLSPKNIVPGAIIVAIDQDYIDVKQSGDLVEITIREDNRTFDVNY